MQRLKLDKRIGANTEFYVETVITLLHAFWLFLRKELLKIDFAQWQDMHESTGLLCIELRVHDSMS